MPLARLTGTGLATQGKPMSNARLSFAQHVATAGRDAGAAAWLYYYFGTVWAETS